MTIRVAHVSQATSAGVGRFLTYVLRDQTSRGWDVHLVAPEEAALVRCCDAVDARWHPWDAVRSPGPRAVGELRQLSRTLKAVDPDVVFLHSSKAGLIGRLALRRRRPTIFLPHAWSFLHGPRPIRSAAEAWERAAARWTDITLCVSDAERRRGQAARVGGEMRTVLNAVDLDVYRPATDDERAAMRDVMGVGDAPLAVCVARLSHQKGQDVLLDAWPRVLREVPDARLILVGEGPERAHLMARRPPNVDLLGALDGSGLMAAADVVVLPSRWEGGSYVALEAMACGTSVVVTDVDGSREALGDPSDVGAVVPSEDPQALADALIERLRDPAAAREEGRRGRARSVAFGLDAWGDAVAEVVAEVASLHEGRR